MLSWESSLVSARAVKRPGAGPAVRAGRRARTATPSGASAHGIAPAVLYVSSVRSAMRRSPRTSMWQTAWSFTAPCSAPRGQRDARNTGCFAREETMGRIDLSQFAITQSSVRWIAQ